MTFFPQSTRGLGTGFASSVFPPVLPDLVRWGHCHSMFPWLRSSADAQSANVKASQAATLEKAEDGMGGGSTIWLDLYALRPTPDNLPSSPSENKYQDTGLRAMRKPTLTLLSTCFFIWETPFFSVSFTFSSEKWS